MIDNCAASYTMTSGICQCRSTTMKLGRDESQTYSESFVTKGGSSPVLTYLQTETRSPSAYGRQLHTMDSDICEEGGRQLTETRLCSTSCQRQLLSERKKSIQSSTPPCLGASSGESAKCLFILIPPHQLSRCLPAISYLPTVLLTRHLCSKQMQHYPSSSAS